MKKKRYMKNKAVKVEIDEETGLVDVSPRDAVTGKKAPNPLNKKHLSKEEMFDIFGWDYIQ